MLSRKKVNTYDLARPLKKRPRCYKIVETLLTTNSNIGAVCHLLNRTNMKKIFRKQENKLHCEVQGGPKNCTP